MQPESHEVFGAAVEYVWYSVVFNDVCLSLDVAVPEELRAGVEAMLKRFIEGERLSGHRSAETFEELRAPFVALWTTKFKTS